MLYSIHHRPKRVISCNRMVITKIYLFFIQYHEIHNYSTFKKYYDIYMFYMFKIIIIFF